MVNKLFAARTRTRTRPNPYGAFYLVIIWQHQTHKMCTLKVMKDFVKSALSMCIGSPLSLHQNPLCTPRFFGFTILSIFRGVWIGFSLNGCRYVAALWTCMQRCALIVHINSSFKPKCQPFFLHAFPSFFVENFLLIFARNSLV